MMSTSHIIDFMAVFAVSGSVVLLANQLHKRLLSDFMKKIESELEKSSRDHSKKKVRFADDVVEPSYHNDEYRKNYRRRPSKHDGGDAQVLEGCGDIMPMNRQVLYKGILQYKMQLKGAMH